MLFTVIVTVAESTMKYGLAPVLEDNFVAQLPTEYGSSVEFLSFYAFINSYIIIMAYVYAPSASVVSTNRGLLDGEASQHNSIKFLIGFEQSITAKFSCSFIPLPICQITDSSDNRENG
uniref:Wntless-like transmembrane domain-containing protein n=1 Tax=Romanomermis culicivorax TaxID=13658 RepID=A0A915K065_ROMCU